MAEDETTQNPFTRPWFIIAAVLVAVVVVAGVVLAVWTATRGDDPPPPDPTSAPTAAPSTPTADAGGASVCGLDGVELTGTVTTAPEAEWEYQDVYSYPVSATAGPGETADEGYRYCFQHTPEGALFAAANALVQGSGPAADAWFEYVLAPGPYRDQLIADQGATQTTTAEGTRLSIVGFRVLAYDGTTARIDLAVRGSAQGTTLTLSGVYELVWEGGDWKVSTDTLTPMNIAAIPDTAGYTPWGP